METKSNKICYSMLPEQNYISYNVIVIDDGYIIQVCHCFDAFTIENLLIEKKNNMIKTYLFYTQNSNLTKSTRF